jgi:hypothetical protein
MTNITLNGVPVSPSMLELKNVVKVHRNGMWLLTSPSGVILATFATEKNLAEWWKALQRLRRSRLSVLVGRPLANPTATDNHPPVVSVEEGGKVNIEGVIIDRAFLPVFRGRKFRSEGHWLLTTRRDTIIAKFSSENVLDRWWATFQCSQQRPVTKLTFGPYMGKGEGSPHPRTEPTDLSTRGYEAGEPWNTQFDMKEF